MGIRGDKGDQGTAVEDAFTGAIIEAIISVHSSLGPGFAEQIYQRALAIELRKKGVRFAAEADVPITYEGHDIGRHRLDFLVEDKVIVEDGRGPWKGALCPGPLISPRHRIDHCSLGQFLKRKGGLPSGHELPSSPCIPLIS